MLNADAVPRRGAAVRAAERQPARQREHRLVRPDRAHRRSARSTTSRSSGASDVMNWRLSGGICEQDGIIRGTHDASASRSASNFQQRLLRRPAGRAASLRGSRDDRPLHAGRRALQRRPDGPDAADQRPGDDDRVLRLAGQHAAVAGQSVAILSLARDRGRPTAASAACRPAIALPFLDGLKANVNLGYDVARTDRQTFFPSILHSQMKTRTTAGATTARTRARSNTGLETYLQLRARNRRDSGHASTSPRGYSYSQSHAEYPWYLADGPEHRSARRQRRRRRRGRCRTCRTFRRAG